MGVLYFLPVPRNAHFLCRDATGAGDMMEFESESPSSSLSSARGCRAGWELDCSNWNYRPRHNLV